MYRRSRILSAKPGRQRLSRKVKFIVALAAGLVFGCTVGILYGIIFSPICGVISGAYLGPFFFIAMMAILGRG